MPNCWLTLALGRHGYVDLLLCTRAREGAGQLKNDQNYLQISTHVNTRQQQDQASMERAAAEVTAVARAHLEPQSREDCD